MKKTLIRMLFAFFVFPIFGMDNEKQSFVVYCDSPTPEEKRKLQILDELVFSSLERRNSDVRRESILVNDSPAPSRRRRGARRFSPSEFQGISTDTDTETTNQETHTSPVNERSRRRRRYATIHQPINLEQESSSEEELELDDSIESIDTEFVMEQLGIPTSPINVTPVSRTLGRLSPSLMQQEYNIYSSPVQVPDNYRPRGNGIMSNNRRKHKKNKKQHKVWDITDSTKKRIKDMVRTMR